MHPLVHSFEQGNGERGRGRAGIREKERMSRHRGSVPVGITRIERSQERARDPRQKTINTDFANSYTPPGQRVALVQSAHILRLPMRLMAAADGRHPSSHVCVDCCAHVRLFNPPVRSPPLVIRFPFPIPSNLPRFTDDAGSASTKLGFLFSKLNLTSRKM